MEEKMYKTEYIDSLELEYFICPECGEKVYLDDCKTDKWWDDEGNHRMIYICKCGYEKYE